MMHCKELLLYSKPLLKNMALILLLFIFRQCLTEEYYVINKLIKGFIGSNNIDTNSRLCMSSAVVAYKMSLG